MSGSDSNKLVKVSDEMQLYFLQVPLLAMWSMLFGVLSPVLWVIAKSSGDEQDFLRAYCSIVDSWKNVGLHTKDVWRYGALPWIREKNEQAQLRRMQRLAERNAARSCKALQVPEGPYAYDSGKMLTSDEPAPALPPCEPSTEEETGKTEQELALEWFEAEQEKHAKLIRTYQDAAKEIYGYIAPLTLERFLNGLEDAINYAVAEWGYVPEYDTEEVRRDIPACYYVFVQLEMRSLSKQVSSALLEECKQRFATFDDDEDESINELRGKWSHSMAAQELQLERDDEDDFGIYEALKNERAEIFIAIKDLEDAVEQFRLTMEAARRRYRPYSRLCYSGESDAC